MTVTMKKKYPFNALIILLTFSLLADRQNLSITIKVQAMDMATALIKNDFTTFSKFMHPGIVSYAAGGGKMKTKMDSAYAAICILWN
jgi:hypothetical protein